MSTKTETKTKTKTATKAKAKTKEKTIESLMVEYRDTNKEANALAAKVRKVRKELYIAMLNEGITEFEADGVACDRYAKESFVIDPIKLKDYLTNEQFWEVIKINKGDAQRYVSDAIIDQCSESVMSNEDVHLRK